MCRLAALTLLCLLAASGVVGDAERPSTSAKQHHQQKWREGNATTLGDAKPTNATSFRASMKDLGVKDRTGKRLSYTLDNKLRELFQAASAGENTTRKKKQDDDDDEDKKTLAQQIADGKYGLIEKEIYSRPALRPGIISYKNNPEVPKDNIKNLGGLDAEEIWLAEDHVLVLRGGWFPNHNFNRTEASPAPWPPIDDYQAPPRQVKIPSRPKVPPPFPVQLADGAPTHFIGPNGTKSNRPFPPPFFPFPPGEGFYPAPGNGSSFPPPPYPFPAKNGSLYPYPENYPPPGNQAPYPPGNFPPGSDPSFPYPPPPHGFMPFPNGSSPYGPLPPFFPPLPPGAAFLPPPGNQTEPDEDDPSIYYPPPYDFFYPRDNSSKVPPGPLVPGIILPPPPNFFAPLNDEKPRTHKRPTSTPLPHVPLNVYPPTASPRPTVIRTQLPPGVYPPTAAPRPPHRSQPPRVHPATAAPRPPVVQQQPEAQPPSFYYPQPPSTTYNSVQDDTTPPPSSTPFGNYVPGQRPTVKRPYLTYVPVTTAGRKKKPRPTTTPKQEYEAVNATPLPPVAPRPLPPKFVSPQNVQVIYKGESPITVRPYYFNGELDNVVTVTPEPQDQREDNPVTSTPRPHYITDGLSKLKDILYSPPQSTPSYHLDRPAAVEPVKKKKVPQVTTVNSVKSVEYTTTETPLKYYTDIEKRPIYVKELDNYNGYNPDPTSTVSFQQAEIDSNSVHPTQQSFRGAKGSVVTTPATLYQSYQPEQPPNRTPKTTYYFYDEPQYEQGFVQDVPERKPYVFNNPSKWQFDNPRPSPQPSYNQPQQNYNQPQQNYNQPQQNYNQPQQNYNQPQPNYQVQPVYNEQAGANYNGAGGVNTQEEILLAQIAATLRQPGNGFYYNSQNKQPQNPAYYNTRGRLQPYYTGQQRPINNNFVNTTPRPVAGFYITKKPDYYQTQAPLKYNGYNGGLQANREFPYNYEDVSQSTEHPLPQAYNTTPRPQFLNIVTPSRLQGPDSKGQTSPKTVYEYSFQKQAADTTNYVSTERQPAPTVRRPTTVRYYEDFSQNVTPETNNQLYQTTTSRPRDYPVIQHATPDPLQNHFTQQDDSVLDDITKKYFTIFGQKLKSDAKFVHTTPLPTAASDDKTRQHQTQRTNYEKQPDSHQQQNYDDNGNVHKPTEIPLYDDVAVNYRTPRPPINPDSEFINPVEAQKYADDDSGGGKLISYKLPGNEGGHFYFVTPQVVPQANVDVSGADSYQYPVPARGFRTRRNKNRQR